jgi:Rieske Fe-S protein
MNPRKHASPAELPRSRRSALRLLCLSSGSLCAAGLAGACASAGGEAGPPGPLVDLPAPARGRLVLPVAAFPQLADAGGGLVGRAPGVVDPIAIARQEESRFVAAVGLCTHMACVLRFNPLNATLDCPCHGSTFELDGRVLTGPATVPLRLLPTDFDGELLSITMP